MATGGFAPKVQIHESVELHENALPVYTGGTGLVVPPVDDLQTVGAVREKPTPEASTSEPPTTESKNGNSEDKFETLSILLVSSLECGVFRRWLNFRIRLILCSRHVKVR